MPCSIASVAAAVVAVGAMFVSLRSAARDVAPPAAADVGLRSVPDDLAACARDVGELRVDLGAIERRLLAVESRRREAPVVAAPTPPPSAAPTDRAVADAAAPAPDAADRAQLLADMARVLRSGTLAPDLSESEQEQFWRRLRTTGVVDGLIADLEAKVTARPHDDAARMQLADAYTAKLLTIPGGPEQGVWGGKAEREWQAVVDQQPDHWEARFALGFNYSMYPSFVDRSDAAIEHLEVARRLLVGMPVEARQVDTFTALARMYQRQGKTERARAVLAEGLQRFPGDEALLRTRQQLGADESR